MQNDKSVYGDSEHKIQALYLALWEYVLPVLVIHLYSPINLGWKYSSLS